jgi:transposase
VISDRYGAYNYFQEGKRQICWSHLGRDYERFAHSSNPSLSEQGRKLVSITQELFKLNKGVIKEQIEKRLFVSRVKKIKKEISYIFKSILRIRGIPQAHRVVKRMQKSFEMMWLFVKKQGIAMTNNLAERQLRKYLIYRKSTRSPIYHRVRQK